MEIFDHHTSMNSIHRDTLMRKKRIESATQRYARWNLISCDKSTGISLSSRLVDIRPPSPLPLPSPSPSPLSLSVDIQPEYLFNSSSSSSSPTPSNS